MNERELFDLVLLLGETMLSSGGEIFRTNELMGGAARAFGLRQCSVFTIANGIFLSAVVDGEHYSCQVRHIPLTPIRLSRVEAMNDLSRRIAGGLLTPQEARAEVLAIRASKGTGPLALTLASAAGAGCFCFLFGGRLIDCVVAFLAGLLLSLFQLGFCRRFSIRKVMSNILSSALVTLICCTAFRLGLGQLDKMIIGSIFPLVPGVALTIAVRNFMENDYIAGLVRLTDALLVASCIAVGVGSVITVWSRLLGGIAL
ncbi:threonine/serine exporter family protein [Pseudoflavonifractor sp. 524-17]|uniref:threonine/serine exporter family protein n=1 Tax=Pseudoflavonifractor sp. 524-17 TaxID=2304577 RepID=UPI001FAC0C82|nr:threonine/serine exporter family protein [Pseudoflavonifractor sp. 524-17]